MQSMEPNGHLFDEVVSFLAVWNMLDQLARVMEYVVAKKDLTLKCRFELSWP